MDDIEKDLYVRAIKAHEKTNTVAENHKPYETLQEKDLYRDTQREATKMVSTMPYTPGQYEQIFKTNQDRLEEELLQRATEYENQ